jgi:hypothetical protein
MITTVQPAKQLQYDVDAFAALLTALLAGIPRKFESTIRNDRIRNVSLDRDDHSLEECAESLATTILATAEGKAIQFIRSSPIIWEDGVVRAGSRGLDLVPVMAMCVPDAATGELMRRFDVRFVIHEN